MNTFRLIMLIAYCLYAHTCCSKSIKKSVRYWDKTTPYFIHPIWCAMTLLTETTLPLIIRIRGASALLLHDVREDTDAKLPSFLTREEKHLVSDMTYSSSEEERKHVWDKSKEVRLYKLYDKTSNLLDSAWMTPEKEMWYRDYTKELIIDVEENYGLLNIVKIAKAVIT